MTKLTLDLNKSVEENASLYYEKAKKAKRKQSGAEEALKKSMKKLDSLKLKQSEEQKDLSYQLQHFIQPSKKEWFEKFRWFISSEGFLVIGGRDATTNEIIIKKYTDENEPVFHTDMAGSPFFVVKSKGKKVGQDTLREVADATCSFSRAWKLGLTTTSVFYVKPEQVTKTPQSGEYLQRGAFVIRGKTEYIQNRINCAVGMTKDGKIMGGPLEAVKKHCEKYVEIEQGTEKPSAVAKKIRAKIGGDLDGIIRAMPSGGVKVK